MRPEPTREAHIESALQPVAASPVGAPALGPVPAGILALQRTAGNRVVNRYLARQSMTAEKQRIDKLERDYHNALRYENWPSVAAHLNAYSDGDIQNKLEALNPGQLDALVHGAHQWALKEFENPHWDKNTDGRIRDHVNKHVSKRRWPTAAKGGKGTYGEFSVVKRSVGGPKYGMQISIYFKPDPKKVGADEIAFIQTVRRVKGNGEDGTKDKAHLDKRKTPNFWFVDQSLGDKLGWYGTHGDRPQSILAPWFRTRPEQPAFMRDTPQGFTGDETFEAEAAAVGKSGPETGKVYGVVTWGFRVDAAMKLTESPVTFKQAVSADFLNAVTKWNDQVKVDEHLRNAPDQTALPAITN